METTTGTEHFEHLATAVRHLHAEAQQCSQAARAQEQQQPLVADVIVQLPRVAIFFPLPPTLKSAPGAAAPS